MYKCKVCGKEFELQKEEHYITRDVTRVGLTVIIGGSEEELYDTFDCPHCGCQNVMQGRKRDYVPRPVLEEAKEEECSDEDDWLAEVEENDDATVAAEEVYAGMYAAERSKCFGQHESDVTCLSCDEEEECLAETERSQNTNDSNVDVAADEDEEAVPRRCRKKKITRTIPCASSVIGPGTTVNDDDDDEDWDA